jgi:HAMP domain-containing protein
MIDLAMLFLVLAGVLIGAGITVAVSGWITYKTLMEKR